MNARVAVLYLAVAGLALAGCNRPQTPAQQAAAIDSKGRSLVLDGQFAQAVTLYTDAISKDGSNGSLYFHRGTARMMDASAGGSSQIDDAILDFTLAIKLDPMVRPSAYHARGDAKHLKGDDEGAKQDWLQGDSIPK